MEELVLFEGDAAKVEQAADTGSMPGLRDDSFVLCLAARDEADYLTSLALCQVLERAGITSRSPEPDALAEVLSPSVNEVLAVICILAMPPFALTHARTLLKKARNRYPTVPYLLCYWQFDGDAGKLASRLKLDAHCQVVTTLPQAIQSIRELSYSQMDAELKTLTS